ncbi:MAG: hypothetical protein EBR82_45840 [Caulobacteraceae bacterium]|nr:hypothetical protein [Caulobacteraceae bacterium]
MSPDSPKLPPPASVAAMCRRRAWDDDVDDETRVALELASRTIRVLMVRLVRQAMHMERIEAKR